MRNIKNLLNKFTGVLPFEGKGCEETNFANDHLRANKVHRKSAASALGISGVILALSALVVSASASADQHEKAAKQVFVTLTSAETQTQGMALVLSNAMQAQGAQIELLLCGGAGNLAVADAPSERLAPHDVSPQMMLKNLMQGGAKVQVCALFLPNAGVSEAELLAGVTAAQPPAIAARLLADGIRVFNF